MVSPSTRQTAALAVKTKIRKARKPRWIMAGGEARRMSSGFLSDGVRLMRRHALFGEHGLQIAGLEHLGDNIGAANKLALHVKLRDGRPVRISLDAFAHPLIGEHVNVCEAHAEIFQDLRHALREAALREIL